MLEDYALDNSNSSTKSYGLELQADWKPTDTVDLKFGYTNTESYDGTTCDNPDSTGGPGSAKCNDEMDVRVPRNQINLSGSKIINRNLSHTLNFKYVGERRDYGNTNQGFEDVILSKYATIDYILNYKLLTLIISVYQQNILNRNYSEAYEYKAPGRSVNFSLKVITNDKIFKSFNLNFLCLSLF